MTAGPFFLFFFLLLLFFPLVPLFPCAPASPFPPSFLIYSNSVISPLQNKNKRIYMNEEEKDDGGCGDDGSGGDGFVSGGCCGDGRY